jgi:cysteine desulfurase
MVCSKKSKKYRNVYMDNAATTPVDDEVISAMLPFFKKRFGNASSLHSFGRDAHNAMSAAREKVAQLIGADADEIIFTAGGTEADNIAIKGIAYKYKKIRKQRRGPHIITSKIEHPAVLETCKFLEKEGFAVKYTNVDKYGIVDVSDIENSISNGTFLITIMHANNEIGTIEPIAEIGRIAQERNIIFHTDAVQSVAKIPVDVRQMDINLLSISAHKFYGPKGVGALYIQEGTKLETFVHGGGHEKGLRSSTENLPGIIGLGKAAELAKKRMKKDMKYLTNLRDKLIKNILSSIEEAYLNGHPTQRLPNNAHFRFTGIEGESLIMMLDEKGIAASTGSACSSKKLEPSHVLMAIGLNEVEAHGSLRLTLGRKNTLNDVKYVCENLAVVIEKLRQYSPLWGEKLELEKWRRELEAKNVQ